MENKKGRLKYLARSKQECLSQKNESLRIHKVSCREAVIVDSARKVSGFKEESVGAGLKVSIKESCHFTAKRVEDNE